MDVKIKGIVISSTIAFVREKFGEETFNKVVEKLSDDTRKVVTGHVIAGATYDILPLLELQRKICEIIGGNAPLFARKIGAFAAERSFRGLFKYLLKLASVPFALKKAPFIYNTFYNMGKMHVLKVDPEKKESIIKLTELPFEDVLWEERIAGWIEKAGEFLGAVNPYVKISKSFARGDEFTEYFVKWE